MSSLKIYPWTNNHKYCYAPSYLRPTISFIVWLRRVRRFASNEETKSQLSKLYAFLKSIKVKPRKRKLESYIQFLKDHKASKDILRIMSDSWIKFMEVKSLKVQIDKTICDKCLKENVPWAKNINFDRCWNFGKVCCRSHGWISTYFDPPDSCPYILEHMLRKDSQNEK